MLQQVASVCPRPDLRSSLSFRVTRAHSISYHHPNTGFMSYCQVVDDFAVIISCIYLVILFMLRTLFNSVSMNIRQENKIINQELSLLTEKEHFYVGGDTIIRIIDIT